MPSLARIYRSLARCMTVMRYYDRATLLQAKASAIENRADRLAEEILELADEQMPDGLEGPLASAWVQQKRMQVDARKWVASKLKPKVYGDRIDVAVTDNRISVMDALKDAKQRVLNDESNVTDVEAKQA